MQIMKPMKDPESNSPDMNNQQQQQLKQQERHLDRSVKFNEPTKVVVDAAIDVHTWKRIFLNITLALIFPITFTVLAHSVLNDILITEHVFSEEFGSSGRITRYDRISASLSWEWIEFWLVNAAFFTSLLIISLLSTTAVVYIVAAAFSGNESRTSFRQLMSLAPKILKRLTVTLAWNFAALVVYSLVSVILLLIALLLFSGGGEEINDFGSGGARMVFLVFTVVYFAGFVYITVGWQLAGAVSVLEDRFGLEVVRMSIVVFLAVNLCLGGVITLFEKMVLVADQSMDRVGLSTAVGLLSVSVVFFFGLVVQTVVYSACKLAAYDDHHCRTIDESVCSLSYYV